MTSRSEADMVALTEALYRADSARVQRLLAEEAGLRADLRQLETMRRTAGEMPQEDASVYRAVGADLLWQGWIGQSKARLHSELARILGRKGQLSRELRRSFGKYQAATQLSEEEARRVVQRRDMARTALLDSLAQLLRTSPD
ncbi:hypothetical protein [uncultured Roseovarius sp.]|uniref:hypothetical protein n=1 Tax=uncultured Roseovarius sp. TaxID=293344 RepID=UPI0026D722D4|tara:strand:+ start:947 stop:1375 length:429 start_codon:yes stop_codon:yes gene_type:complete